MRAQRTSTLRGFNGLVARLRSKRAERPRRVRLAGLLSVFPFVVVATCLWPWVRAHLQAAAVLDLVAGQRVPVLLRPVVGEPVTTQDLTIHGDSGPIRARLYTPTLRPDAPALVVLHGVHHLGMDEPRLIAFASAMSACGLRVLTPELPGIKDYHVDAESVRTIGESAKWLATQPPGRRPVGVMGLSFSGGLSLLAASDPTYGGFIRFVVAIGSQYSMGSVAAYYRTGSDARPKGLPELLAPHEYGALVMEYQHPEDFVPTADVESMRTLLRAHLYEDVVAEKAAMSALTPAQQGEAVQLLNTTSAATRAMLAAEETKHIEAMAGVSPQGHLKTLITPVYLLHGEGDNIIPAAESLWMADELPSESLQAVLVSPVLSHLDLNGAQPGMMDQWRLVHFFARLLHTASQP